MTTDNLTIESSSDNNTYGGCMVLQKDDSVFWNTSDNIMSDETRDLISKLTINLFLPLTFLIGVPANVINMAVFYRHGLKERINVCLFALSLADGLYLFFNMFVYSEQFYLHFVTAQAYGSLLWWILNHYLLGLNGLAWVSQLLSAIIASERCFCVLQPLKSQTILHTSTMTAIIVAVFVVVLAGQFVVVTRFYTVCAYDPVSDSVILTSIGGEFYHRHKKLVDFLDVFLYGVGLPWVVIMVVLVTTIITVIKLRQAAEWRAGVSSSSASVSARDIALTRMLVGNSIFFIACVFPVGLFRFVMLVVPELNTGQRYFNLFIALGMYLLNTITYINSTFNFVVYYSMSSRYRETVWALVGRKMTKDTSSSKTAATEKTR